MNPAPKVSIRDHDLVHILEPCVDSITEQQSHSENWNPKSWIPIQIDYRSIAFKLLPNVQKKNIHGESLAVNSKAEERKMFWIGIPYLTQVR